eukprot:10928730-Alexandrium_andersonii.AAC.1
MNEGEAHFMASPTSSGVPASIPSSANASCSGTRAPLSGPGPVQLAGGLLFGGTALQGASFM